MRAQYTPAYHAAISHLIRHGVWEGNPQAGRDLCARALRDLRLTQGRPAARAERYHMKQICGCFPVKATVDAVAPSPVAARVRLPAEVGS